VIASGAFSWSLPLSLPCYVCIRRQKHETIHCIGHQPSQGDLQGNLTDLETLPLGVRFQWASIPVRTLRPPLTCLSCGPVAGVFSGNAHRSWPRHDLLFMKSSEACSVRDFQMTSEYSLPLVPLAVTVDLGGKSIICATAQGGTGGVLLRRSRSGVDVERIFCSLCKTFASILI